MAWRSTEGPRRLNVGRSRGRLTPRSAVSVRSNSIRDGIRRGGIMMMQGGFSGPMLRLDASITRQKVRPGTVQRIFPYAMAYRWMLVLLLLVTAIDSAVQVANPLLLGLVIDLGILPHRIGIVIALSLAIA